MSDVANTTTATLPPATTASANQTNLAAGQSSLNSSFSTFLTLLTTQLQNQDPTSPLDTNAFTQQLVAMTGVQQQLLTNQLLQQIAGSSGGGVASAVGLIGKTASATSSTATLASGAANWSYNLPNDAAGATITVSDANGQAVFSTAATGLTAGDHGFTWNGKDFSGLQRPDGGTYTLSVMAADASGTSIPSTISVTGQVGSVTQSNGQTLVKIGPTAVPLASITTVSSQ
jgi:flagellar basal-body rod modification protein FlgD